MLACWRELRHAYRRYRNREDPSPKLSGLRQDSGTSPFRPPNWWRPSCAACSPDTVIALGGAPGVDQSFSTACRRLMVKAKVYLVDFGHLGDYRFSNRERLRRGAGLCIIVHRNPLDEGNKDLARQATEPDVPTYLVKSEQGRFRYPRYRIQ